jgi:glycosyltransferase involved in cell wall biosynthesis
LNVLILTTSYPRNKSDLSGIFIKRLAVAMMQSGVTVTILAPADKDAEFSESDQGILVRRFFYAPRKLMKIAYGDGGIPENLRRWPWLVLILPCFVGCFAAYTIILAKDHDVIHANWLPAGLVALFAKWIRRKPLVVTLRGNDLVGAASRLLPFVGRWADAITTVNTAWAKDLRQRMAAKVFYTPNGVGVSDKVLDLRAKFRIGRHEIIVLYVGSLIERKGADLLAKTAKAATERNCYVKFLVIGPGSPAEFGLDQLLNVLCIGGIPPDQALAAYRCCDIFVLPSRSEGRPNALLEAMASGLPSVATRIPGVLEVLTEESGILVDVGDSDSLTEAICALAKDPVRRKLMGEKARDRITDLSLSWQASAENYLRVFGEVRSCAG